MFITKSYGKSISELEMSCPTEIKPYEKLYELEQRKKDEDMWIMGMYVYQGVSVSLDHAFSGKKAKSKYAEKPLFSEYFENKNLTQEELDRRRLDKMIAEERARMLADQFRNLPKPNTQ